MRISQGPFVSSEVETTDTALGVPTSLDTNGEGSAGGQRYGNANHANPCAKNRSAHPASTAAPSGITLSSIIIRVE